MNYGFDYMHYTNQQIKDLNRVRRLNIINSVSGIKPANLIGTISDKDQLNLAIFSSVVHLGSDPALLGFIMRPTGDVPRHTYENIKSTGVYTINHVQQSIIKKAHYTSAKVNRGVSEFDACNLTAEFLNEFKAPYVKESQLKMGMKLVDEIPIPINGTVMMVGEIQHLYLPDVAVADNGWINLEKSGGVGISGLNSYYQLKQIDSFPYARPHEIPDFE